MKINLIYLTAICFCLITCKKDNQPEISSYKIVCGTKTDVIIHDYDSILIGSRYVVKSFDFDVNSDGSADFQLTSEIYGSAGQGYHPRAKLLCLNSNCMINGYLSSDTIFKNFQSDTIYDSFQEKVKITNRTIYSCERIDNADSIKQIQTDQFKYLSKNKGDYLDKSEFFKSTTITLSDEWSSSFELPVNHNDTIIENYYQNHYTCHSFPSDVIQYIGIKIKDGKNDKIGWLKISISENYKISIWESAIQK